MRFALFDRWGTQTGVINDVISAIHKDELNGEDSLTLTLASCDLAKGDRIVWRDKFGTWHEHIVNDLKAAHEDGRMYTVAYCETSLAELFTDYIEELRPYKVSATVALQRALSVTRWAIGTVDVQGTGSASFYHISSREALTLITENWGGELSATIGIGGTQVTSRSVNVSKRGADNGKRFEWTKDLAGITREVSTEDVCTALYGYGKGLEAYDEDGNPTGGYERKLTFGDINGGLDYVADEDARLEWGLPDGKGGIKHTFGKVEFPECEDMGELLELTLAELQKRKAPQVAYTASVIDLADAGYEFEDVRTGDTVAIIDRELGERLTGRVLCVERDLFNESATVVTLGNIVRSISDVISDQIASLNRMRDHSAAWDGAASLSESYINGVIRVWNDTMNASGGYMYYEPGDGIITYDKPEDQNPTMAIQIKGAGFRIANSKKSDGSWDWRTFGTGDGFTADCLNVGTIRGGSNYWNLETGDLLFERGSIRTADNSSYWDMTNNEVKLSATVQIGSSTAGDMVTNISNLQADSKQFTIDISSHSQTLTQLKATYCTCTTAGATQEKKANCSGFALRTGAIVAVKFSYANTVASPTLNVNDTGAKPIYLNGSVIPEANWWKAGDVVTLVYNGSYWYVADGSTLTQLASTNTNVANLTLRADTFDVSIKGIQSSYATCSTAAATQEKVVTLANFTKFVGQTVTVKFTYANTAENPKLTVQNSDGSVSASGFIVVNNSFMGSYYYWAAQGVMTFVWDGSYWRVGDGSTLSQIKVLSDSITLSVTNASLGNTASIKLSVNGAETTKTLDLTGVRNAFKNDTTAITITAGTVTFNSNTFVVNSSYFSVTSAGVITATSGTIGGFTINSTQIYNGLMTLDSTGLTLKRDSTVVGKIGTNTYVSDSSKKGLVFDLDPGGAYMTWAVKASSSDTTYTMKLTYAKSTVGSLTSGRLHVQCPVKFWDNIDLNDYLAYNFWIDASSGGANGGISGTLNFTKITNAQSDGSFNYSNGCKMTFKNGMLTAATW